MPDEDYREPCSLAEEAGEDGQDLEGAEDETRFHARHEDVWGTDVIIVLPARVKASGELERTWKRLALDEAGDFLRELQAAVNGAQGVRSGRWRDS